MPGRANRQVQRGTATFLPSCTPALRYRASPLSRTRCAAALSRVADREGPVSIRQFLRRPAWRGVWLGLACALAAWALASMSLFRGLEDWMLDGCFSGRGTRTTQTRVVLIGLDEPSLRDLGKSTSYL